MNMGYGYYFSFQVTIFQKRLIFIPIIISIKQEV